MYAKNAEKDSIMVTFLRPFHMMFYKSRLLASLESKEVSSEDEPKNGQGVVRGMCILPDRRLLFLPQNKIKLV